MDGRWAFPPHGRPRRRAHETSQDPWSLDMTEKKARPEPRRWTETILTRDEQREEKRRALIHQAGLAFRRKGFHETSMEDVAQSLGVTKGALYRYVKNKQEILFECHKLAMELGDAALQHGRAQGGNGFEKVRLTLATFLRDYISSNSAGAAIVNIDELEPEHRHEIIRRRSVFDHGLRAMIVEGIEDGSIAPRDPRIIAFSIMGAINWLPRWYNPDGELSHQAVTEQMLDFFINGMRPQAGGGMLPVPATAPAAAKPAPRRGRTKQTS